MTIIGKVSDDVIRTLKKFHEDIEVPPKIEKVERIFTHPTFICRVCKEPGQSGGHLNTITGLHDRCYDSVVMADKVFIGVKL